MPCLVLPGSDPRNPAQWLRLDDLIQVIDSELVESAYGLIVLDCVRSLTDWDSGTVYNTFARQLATSVSAGDLQRIGLLCAVQEGQQNWEADELQGTCFGTFFRLGLAGLADRRAGVGSAAGNGDGQISLDELVHYLSRQMPAWTNKHVAAVQAPQFLPESTPQRRLAWCLNGSQLSAIERALEQIESGTALVNEQDLNALWEVRDRGLQNHVFKIDPLGWSQWERRLLRLEELSNAGAGYFDSAERMLLELKDQAEQIDEISKTPSNRRGLWGPTLQINSWRPSFLTGMESPSLAWSEYLGNVPPTDGDAIHRQIEEVITAPADQWSQQLDLLSDTAGRREWSEVNFLRLLQQANAPKLWNGDPWFTKALNLRQSHERLILSGDERLHGALSTQLNRVDVLRRKIEDRLFAGPQALDKTLWNLWERELENLDPQGDSPVGKLSQAQRIRDRALAEALAWSRWCADPQIDLALVRTIAETLPNAPRRTATTSSTAVSTGGESIINRHLLPWLNDVRDLSERLAEQAESSANQVGDNNGTLATIFELAKVVETERLALHDLFDKSCQAVLSEKEPTGLRRRHLHAALQSTLADAALRQNLRKKMQGWSKSDTDDNVAPRSLDNTAEPVVPSIEHDYVTRADTWDAHPLLMLCDFASADSPGDFTIPVRDWRSLTSMATKFQRRWTALPHVDSAEVARWHQEDHPNKNVKSADDSRENIARAEHLTRAISGLLLTGNSGDVAPNDAIYQLRTWDSQALALWYAERQLDDFYATASTNDRSSITAIDFFNRACELLLKSVSQIGALPATMETERQRLDQLRQVRHAVAPYALTLMLRQTDSGDNGMTIQGVLDTTGSNRADTAMPMNGSSPSAGIRLLPEGDAALTLAGSTDSTASSPEQRVLAAIPPAGQQATVDLGGPTGQLSDLRGVAFFRGHRYLSPMLLRPDQGVQVRAYPRFEPTSSLVLRGDQSERISVEIVLDCSWSMGEPALVEAQGETTQPRLQLAKSAVQSLLRQLANRRDVRVGVRLFGHRVAWSRPTATPIKGQPAPETQLMWQANYKGVQPDLLDPSQDTELLLPLGRFDVQLASRVEGILDSIVPWGQSPLYLSLAQAMADFANEDSDSQRFIIVITDGDNFQFSPKGRNAPSTSLAEVQQLQKAMNVPIFVLGFAIPETEAQTTSENFQKIADTSGGAYYPVTSGGELLRALQGSLSVGRFALSGPLSNATRSDQAPSVEGRLNAPITLDVDPAVPQSYELSYRELTEPVTLEGGEGLELEVIENGSRIITRPFEKELPVSAALFRGSTSGLNARAHLPLRDGTNVSFPVSWQDQQRAVTKRPAEVWIEVTPVIDGQEKSDHIYTFYDPVYESRRPVPYVRCNAIQWPTEARQAAIRIWLKDQPTPPMLKLRLSDLIRDPAANNRFVPLGELPGVSYRLQFGRTADGKSEVKVNTQHEPDSLPVQSVRVQLLTPVESSAREIVHQWEARSGTSAHSFQFTADVFQRLADEPRSQLLFATRSAIQTGAWHLADDRPLVVEVRTVAEALPLDAATGRR